MHYSDSKYVHSEAGVTDVTATNAGIAFFMAKRRQHQVDM